MCLKWHVVLTHANYFCPHLIIISTSSGAGLTSWGRGHGINVLDTSSFVQPCVNSIIGESTSSAYKTDKVIWWSSGFNGSLHAVSLSLSFSLSAASDCVLASSPCVQSLKLYDSHLSSLKYPSQFGCKDEDLIHISSVLKVSR